jgi:hypothetical protein
MSDILALTVEIPDWLFSGQYWNGFFTCLMVGIVVFAYGLAKFNPFD